MPIYEYLCKACGKKTEAIQKFSDPPLATCPNCQGDLAKIVSKTSFQLKGAGWYATDYKSTPKSPDAAPASTGTVGEKPASVKTAETVPTPPAGVKKD